MYHNHMNKTKLKKAIKKAGSAYALSVYLGVSKQFINQVTNYYGLTGNDDSIKRPLSKKHWPVVEKLIIEKG